MKTQYIKGGNEGSVMLNNGEYVAVTAVKSAWFKTLKGAHTFMTKNGYSEVIPMSANEMIAYSEKLERTMDCQQVSHFLYREFGYDCHKLPFYNTLKDYLEAVMICETKIHPNGYTYYKWVDANLCESAV